MNYILLIPYINFLGGGQLYALRRAKYLKNKGINVIILTTEFNIEELILKEFKDFNIITLPKKAINNLVLNKEMRIMIQKIEAYLKLDRKIFIESCFAHIIAERLAEKLKARHSIYIIAEFEIYKDKNLKFYLEKFKRKEVIGVAGETLKISFGKHYNPALNRYVNISFEKNEILSNPKMCLLKRLNKDKEKIRIVTISRLEKGYIPKMIEAILQISQKYESLKFDVVIVGDSSNKTLKETYQKRYKSLENCNINFLGYISPLFSEIYENTDLFIGMGTALVNALAFGVVSLGIDPRNNKTSGFFGKDLFSFGYHSNDITWEIYEKIEEYINLKLEDKIELKQKIENIYEEEYSYEKTMQKLDLYIIEEKKEDTYIETKKYYLSLYVYFLKAGLKKIGLFNFLKKFINKIYKRKKFIDI